MKRRKGLLIPLDSKRYKIYEYGLLLIGSFLIAVSFNLFLNPNRIASGGVSGISTIIEAKLHIEAAYTQWVLNIPLFIAGILLLGKRFGLKTAVGSVVLPLFVLITRDWKPLTHNLLLATIYGGIGIGAGLGIVFRGRGSTGGLDLAAQIIHRYTGLSLGIAILLLDGSVITAAGLLLSPEKALYALIGLLVTSKTIDVLQVGLNVSKMVYIVTTKEEEVSQAVLNDLDRGLTRFSAFGGFTGEPRPVLMVVVSQMEVMKLKMLVQAIDPAAFVILSEAREVLGEGFRNHT